MREIIIQMAEEYYKENVAKGYVLPELIRCKDCKYNNGGRCSWHGGAGYKWVVDDDDYCSCAERKK